MMHITMQGSCVVRGQSTYTAQNAWIQNASLKNNILMGRPFYAARYDAVLKACALEQDLQALPAGALDKPIFCALLAFPWRDLTKCIVALPSRTSIPGSQRKGCTTAATSGDVLLSVCCPTTAAVALAAAHCRLLRHHKR